MTLFLNPFRSTKTLAITLAAVAPSLLFAQFPGALAPPAELADGFNSISEDLAREHLEFLAGPECAGRGTGQEGFMVAARYIAEQFEAMGLEPIGDDGSYFQGVPFTSTTPDPAGTILHGPSGPIKLGIGISVSGASGNFSLEQTNVVFVNMKSTVTQLPEGLDVDGKLVILTLDQPNRRAAFMFRRAGAKMLVTVVDEIGDSPSSITRGSGGNRNSNRAPSVNLARRYATMLARSMGAGTDIVKAGSANGEEIVYKDGNGLISFTVSVKSDVMMVPNVVGYLPGSDPTLKEQYIGVGAHLDHLGTRNGVMYPGADDDGSGTTAMLLVAKAITSSDVKPKRSIVFMAFNGEEMGLIGSRYYTENPIIPLEKMACLLQMDMVGRNEEKDGDKPEDNVDTIHLVGSKRISQELHDITIAANKHIGFKFEYDEEGVYGRSDHANFARKGVPITFLFSGFHPDYHQPTDTVDKINFRKILSSARLNYLVVQKVASLPEMVKRDNDGG